MWIGCLFGCWWWWWHGCLVDGVAHRACRGGGGSGGHARNSTGHSCRSHSVRGRCRRAEEVAAQRLDVGWQQLVHAQHEKLQDVDANSHGIVQHDVILNHAMCEEQEEDEQREQRKKEGREEVRKEGRKKRMNERTNERTNECRQAGRQAGRQGLREGVVTTTTNARPCAVRACVCCCSVTRSFVVDSPRGGLPPVA